MPASENERELIDELVGRNPNVDPKLLSDALALLDELQREGVPQAEYNIQSPYQAFPRRA